MDSTQRTPSALQARALSDVTQLIQRFENILSHAQGGKVLNARASQVETGNRNATAVATYQMGVEAAGLTRAAEDVLSLIRELKQLWFDGQLQTIGTSQSEKEAEKYALDVGERLKRLHVIKSERQEIEEGNEVSFEMGEEDASRGMRFLSLGVYKNDTPFPPQKVIESRESFESHRYYSNTTQPRNVHIPSPSHFQTSMPPSPLPPLTLIVATTPTLGIGLRGSLPWPPLKSDLAFFARVTKRPPPPYIHPATSTTHNDAPKQNANVQARAVNAVIMGRKTWDSIPPKFRPLKGRVNVVISRNRDMLDQLGKLEGPGDGASTRAVGAESILDAVQALQKHYGNPDADVKLGRVFVIGGASIYEQAMGMECWMLEGREEWQRKSKGELREWSGEEKEGMGEVQREGDVEFEVQMWERSRDLSRVK
ncbi:hypothetical protein G7Y79_00066g095330 [Physcia stellaris]|nr:hypothetical protein G7Y79_00066g095330 [Physcia stellaris]